ncbi:hypothetical protein D3C72_1939860 [compost metagenome]
MPAVDCVGIERRVLFDIDFVLPVRLFGFEVQLDTLTGLGVNQIELFEAVLGVKAGRHYYPATR